MTDYSREESIAKKQTLDKIAADVLKPINLSIGFKAWMGFLSLALLVCLGAYVYQLKTGLIVTGLRDYVNWGMYIAHFVFFIATALVGMLISAVLGLIGVKWIKPLTRISEIIAIGFAAVAGLVIVSDMGRPDRIANLLLHGRIQSPILWDVTVVTTYMIVSVLLLLYPLLPDLAISLNGRMNDKPKWLQKLYKLMSLNWVHKKEQFEMLHKMIRILLIVIIPTAFAIHTVTSWLFASTMRTGWDSTIFGPYFLSGAFVAGVAGVIIMMFFVSKNYKLDAYITDYHFDKIAKLFVLVMVVYLYFNINEFLVPAYKMKKAEAHHIHLLFSGSYAPLFWFVQICGLILPILLLLIKKIRTPKPMLIIAIFVLAASWLKRYLIVVPTMENPFLPIQNVPHEYQFYTPTMIEIAVTAATFIMALMIITILSKLIPIIPMWEVAEEMEKEEAKILADK